MLAGRTALVTGSARGIGAACVRLLAANGANVGCVDMSSSMDTITSVRQDAATTAPLLSEYMVDITNKENVTDLVAQVTTDMGAAPTLLVNCAGITRDGWLWKMEEDDYDMVLNTNLKAPFLLTQAVAKRIISESKLGGSSSGEPRTDVGSIVNISSIIGKVGNLGQTNYSAAKAGLIGMTKASAKDLARYGIRVNAILPGFIQTPMAAAVPEKILEKTRQQIPMGYLGEPSDIAEGVLYFCERRSKYVTGSVLEITGGLYM
jgi:17beta-estradiol 17-dehydrogenase/3alpha(17beta)-hydroxysteroid dehydrogenase (NAD+)